MDASKLKLAVVGLGGWGKNVVRSFSRAARCELATICDNRPFVLNQQADLYPQAAASDDFQQVLGDPDLKAVAIATPAALHYEMVRAALLADKHVYVEKPMTLCSRHAEELVRLAEQRNRKLMVGHLLEYHPAVELIKQLVDDGELGDIHYMYCQRLNLGVVRQNENVFWSLAPHDLSVILYLLDQEPSEVVAHGQCYLQPGIEDVVFANLRFSTGQMAQIHVSWLDPHKERRLVLVGSKKMLVFDDMQPSEKIRIYDKGTTSRLDAVSSMQAISIRHGDIHIPHLPGGEPLLAEAQHFVDCVLNDKTPRSDGRDGLRVVKILEQVDRQLTASGDASAERKNAAA